MSFLGDRWPRLEPEILSTAATIESLATNPRMVEILSDEIAQRRGRSFVGTGGVE